MSRWESSGKSDEWYTPLYIFDAMGCAFDLDVAAPQDGPRHVPTLSWINRDSLLVPWQGFVWMNPPFGGRNGLVPWLDKFVAHGNGVALVPDRTSAPWFQRVLPCIDLVLFVGAKIKFERPDGSVGRQPGTGTALLAIGPRGCDALRAAAARGLGHCLKGDAA